MSHTATNDGLTHGTLAQLSPNSIILALPGTDYKLHLALTRPLANPQLNKPISGVIHARAKRIDVVRTGGKYIEPVNGRPRRLQGRVTASDTSALTVQCAPAASFTCTLMPPQKPSAFPTGTLVSFDVERGASFEPMN